MNSDEVEKATAKLPSASKRFGRQPRRGGYWLSLQRARRPRRPSDYSAAYLERPARLKNRRGSFTLDEFVYVRF